MAIKKRKKWKCHTILNHKRNNKQDLGLLKMFIYGMLIVTFGNIQSQIFGNHYGRNS